MKTVEKLKEKLEAGEYDRLLSERYGEENLLKQKDRLTEDLTFFGNTYGWARTVRIYSIPYSIILGSDGADLAIPTDIDLVALVSLNETNVTRMRIKDFTGEDNMDIYQHGPYGDEYERTMGVLRGIREAFAQRGNKIIYGLDIYFDGPTVMGIGLDEKSHLAAAIAYIFNDQSAGGKFTPRDLAEMVQWGLINYAATDAYLTDTYSTIHGKTLIGNFADMDHPEIGEPENLDISGYEIYTVNTGATRLIPEEEMTRERNRKFARWLGKGPYEAGDTDFYPLLLEKESDDPEALVYYMDYYSVDNFSDIYYSNYVEGDGSPSLEPVLREKKPSTGGAAAKYHCKPYNYYNMVLCCVKKEVENTFLKACEMLFGAGRTAKVRTDAFPAKKIID